ncbi:MAG: histidine phosphatase family protein [Deltaproteobacteria bacterium]|nr:histidine phosphatase family protein [Deltaproteobacteria bacterium]
MQGTDQTDHALAHAIFEREAFMTRVYLVRHGQTEWNRELRFRGRADIALNENGHKQARAIAHALKDNGITAIYTSPLMRSIETARPTAAVSNTEITTVQGLIDINYGEWEGLAYDEVRQRYAELYRQWEERPDLVTFPKGESLDEVRSRAFSAFTEIVGENRGKSILIIPHRVINKVLLCALLGLSTSKFWSIRQDTGCINGIEYSNCRFVLVTMNDTCHLRGMSTEVDHVDF